MQKRLNSELFPITYAGFTESEVVEIKSGSLFDASKKFGRIMRLTTQKQLQNEMPKGSKREFGRAAGKHLAAFRKLVEAETLNVDGTDYGRRYLDALEGYCEGAGISLNEGVFLQADVITGCQTIISQDKRTREIRIIHTEENAPESSLVVKKYNYKLVRMVFPDKTITFFAYPGLCGWGPAFGINETVGFVQAVDDLAIKSSFPNSGLWATMLSFIFLDCGDFDKIAKVIKILKPIIKNKGTVGGYGVHMAAKNLKMESVEFGGNDVSYTKPKSIFSQNLIVQVNYPINTKIKRHSLSHPPETKYWNNNEVLQHVEMKYRAKRLYRLAKNTKWPINDSKLAIKKGLELLANPYSDLAIYSDTKDGVRYYHTGLPSEWTVAHLVAYFSLNHQSVYVGKLLPKPLTGMKYSLKVNENYKFAEKKLWEVAEKEKARFKKRKL